MSPSILQLRTSAIGAEFEQLFLDEIGPNATIDDVAAMSIDDLLAAQSRIPMTTAGLKNFSPTEGTDTFPDRILERVAADERPLVVGTNRDEMLLFTAFDPERGAWNESDVEREFARRFVDGEASAIEAYRHHRPDSTPSALVSAMQTDEVFRRPAQRVAEQRTAVGNATWMYSFDQVSTAFGGVLGSCHGLDLPFAFHTLDAPGTRQFIGEHGDRDAHQGVADQFVDALVGFAHDHDPGWAHFDRTERATQRIGPDPAVVDDPEAALRTLWPT